MNMQETGRLVFGLTAAGWSEKEIMELIQFIESGDGQYKPGAERSAFHGYDG